jgi:hypothetical chaperone protein
MHTFCGLDFGTSNSTVGICINNNNRLVPLENDKPTIRSAIFCDGEQKTWEFGQKGIDHYLEGVPGRLMMALKSVLGTSLINDKTMVFNEYVSYADILGHFIKYIKTKAENTLGTSLTHAVLGRPVRFDDHDLEKDKLAQDTLESIALNLGFKEVSFQYEPIAAALAYETTIQKEQLALIIDMGGGTSDFTVIRLHPKTTALDRSHDVLANCGIHIAGTDFDKKLSLHSVMPLLGMGSLVRGLSGDIETPVTYYHDLTTWHTLNNLYDAKTISHVRSIQATAYQKHLIERLILVLRKKAGHHILDSVEQAKQRLSDQVETTLDLDFIESELHLALAQTTLNSTIEDLLDKITLRVKETVQMANVDFSAISAIFYTGGSTKIPVIRNKINELFPSAHVIQGDAFGSVGLGLTIDAQRRYG